MWSCPHRGRAARLAKTMTSPIPPQCQFRILLQRNTCQNGDTALQWLLLHQQTLTVYSNHFFLLTVERQLSLPSYGIESFPPFSKLERQTLVNKKTKQFTSYGNNQGECKISFYLGPIFFFKAAQKFWFCDCFVSQTLLFLEGPREEGTLQN